MANWADLLEDAYSEGLVRSWRAYHGAHPTFGLFVTDANGKEHAILGVGASSILDGLADCIANLRRARRKPVAEMDADELDAEARAFGCVFDGGDIRCNHRGERFYRVADEPLTAFLRRVVTRIREQETN